MRTYARTGNRMTSRPRNLQFQDENENNSNLLSSASQEELIEKGKFKIKKEHTNQWIKAGIICTTAVTLMILFFFLGAARERATSSSKYLSLLPSESKSDGRGKKTMELAVHWSGDPITLNKFGDSDGDACELLSECFKSKYFVRDPEKYPDNPLQPCHATLRNILRSFDSGFYYDGPRLVGFVSSDLKRSEGLTGGHNSIDIYNVCVRKEERGKGIGKTMIPDFIKAIVDRHNLKDSKTYVGLDVDFDTESGIAAFAMYAKMGFNRWWEFCPSISSFDYKVMERQSTLANPVELETNESSRPTFIFPMSQIILRRQETIKNQLKAGRGKVLTHFCMVMLLGSDDFGAIGSDLKKMVKDSINAQQ